MPKSISEISAIAVAADVHAVKLAYDSTLVLRGLNLQVRVGEFCVIVGRSGTGKTTLLKVIAGLLKPQGGRVLQSGRVRMVFQDPVLLPWMTVGQNIALGAVDTSVVGEILDDFGISELARRYPKNISGGEKQRVAFGRAFAGRPDLVCCDEPFGQLDILTRHQMQAWLLDFWQQHRTTIIFTTHDLEEGLLLADRLCILEHGVIAYEHDVNFPRPRGDELRYTREFLEARRTIHNKMETINGKMAGV